MSTRRLDISRDNTAAVFVTYHPDGDFPARLAALTAQVDRVFIIDNQSSPDELAMLRRLAASDRVVLIENPDNFGIARALNIGAAEATRAGYSWLLMMDQDTLAQPGMVAALAATYESCPFKEQVGIVAANFDVPAFDRSFVAAPDETATYVESATAITAGSLLRLAAYQTAGAFREDFFIDFVDNEYSLRLRKFAWRVIYSPGRIMNHAIGAPKRYKLLWLRPVSSNHSPLRRYYITRNRLVTDSVYFIAEPRAVMQDYYRLAGETFLLTLLEERKLAKWWAMALGAWHAMIGRGGKLSKEPWHRV